MAVSRMLKVQIVAHASIKEEIKAFLREAGVIEVTDASVEGFHGEANEAETERFGRLLEKADSAVQYLEPYVPKRPFIERLGSGPMRVSEAEIEATLASIDIDEISQRCTRFESAIRKCRDELAWSAALVRELEPWLALQAPFESLSTERYRVQFWTLSERIFDTALNLLHEKHPLSHLEQVERGGGAVRAAIIVPNEESESAAELLKQAGGVRSGFDNLTGTPAAVIDAERRRRAACEAEIAKTQDESRALSRVMPELLTVSDYFREKRGLLDVERHFHRTQRTFVIEGWMRAVNRRRLERDLAKRWSDVELAARPPREGEDPPIHLENRPAAQPFEFVMTLYGRPQYGEIDPTPYIAPFFMLFFSLCLTDAGYGFVLAGLCGLFLYGFKIRGGMRNLLQVLFFAGIITIVTGAFTGGYFGIETNVLPAALQRIILIDPLKEPMKMLDFAFLLGIIHILFGIGIRMVVNFRAHLWADAIFSDLLWILFLMALAPLGYRGILGGNVPSSVMFYCSRAAIGIAAALFVSGMRKEKNKFFGIFKSIIKFYDVTGYFGDVLSYARLLALGLATAAIALAINGIAEMVKGLPHYTGYVAFVLVLVVGHLFNITVNTLGAFVHSARLQYLEFFNKFFTGGGREFRPFRSERRYTIVKEIGTRS
jgi:V/A-type H+-transporting ATPase subunit I